MIRINLLGQIRPKAARRPVDTGAALPVVFIGRDWFSAPWFSDFSITRGRTS